MDAHLPYLFLCCEGGVGSTCAVTIYLALFLVLWVLQTLLEQFLNLSQVCWLPTGLDSVSQTGWHKTTEMPSLTLPEAGGLKLRCL